MKANLFKNKNRIYLFCKKKQTKVTEKECDICSFFKDKETSYYKSLKYWYNCQRKNLIEF